MRNRIQLGLMICVAFLLGSLANSRLARVNAQNQNLLRLQVSSSPLGPIPRAWGSLRGVSDKYLVFEDSSGTIRIVFIDSGVQNYTQIERQ
jgi:hypothetical protein